MLIGRNKAWQRFGFARRSDKRAQTPSFDTAFDAAMDMDLALNFDPKA